MIQVLFQSVQLNINNPNFLIMQARITKAMKLTLLGIQVLTRRRS